MLNQDEVNYLSKIPEDKTVSIQPFSFSQTKTAKNIILKVKAELPHLEIRHMGASGLEISGQGDLDIYALASPKDFNSCLDSLIQVLGVPKSKNPSSIAWKFEENGYPIEFYLTDPESNLMKRQMAVFELLKSNPELLSEYELLKSKMDGQSFRDYQKKKYEFYHKILNER